MTNPARLMLKELTDRQVAQRKWSSLLSTPKTSMLPIRNAAAIDGR